MSTTLNYSAEQIAIFNWFARGPHSPQNLNGTGHAVVTAFAGTGKTTTIKAAFEHAPEKRILYAVFNKRNQKEAEEKITDSRVEVKTLHSLGFSFIKRVWNNAKPDDNVEFDRVEQAHFNVHKVQSPKIVTASIVRVIGFAKNTCIEITEKKLEEIAEAQDIDLNGAIYWTKVAMGAIELARARDAQGRISFNDMVWLPVAMGWVKQWFDLVCVDEAQDMNLPQLSMARAACKTGGRIIVVGDDNQAIYGFRGAVQNGVAMMKATLRADTLTLSTTYRCPKAVVELAARIVPGYLAAPNAPQGEVSLINENKMIATAATGDAILSRLNAPLMPLALQFLRNNIPARIEGRDVGKQLIGMVRTFKAKSVEQFIEKVNEWESKQIERLEKTRTPEKKMELVHDTAETLIALADSAKEMIDVENRILSLFQDTDSTSQPAIVLSTVHKAKGLEWNRVFVLSETFRAGKTREESNIYYVAVTRAMKTLFLVSGKGAAIAPAPAPKSSEAAPEVKAVSPVVPVKSGPPARIQKPAKARSGKKGETVKSDSFDIPTGLVRRQLGDVFIFDKVEYMVEMVNGSRAAARCLSKVRVVIKKDNGATEFDRSAGTISVSTTCHPSDIIRRIDLKNLPSSGVQLGGDSKTTDSESIKLMKEKMKGSDRIAEIVRLAGEGQTIAQITSAMKKLCGQDLGDHTTYIIGREWRRVNKAAEKAKPAAKAKPAKVAAAPVAKVAPPARAKAPAKPAPAAKSAPAKSTPPAPAKVVKKPVPPKREAVVATSVAEEVAEEAESGFGE